MASGSVDLYLSSGTSGEAVCRVVIDGAMASQFTYSDFSSTGFDVQVPVEGSAVVGPGPHTVSVQCSENVGDIFYDRGDLLTWTA